MSTEQVGGLTREELRDRLGTISFMENEGPADPFEQRAWNEVLAHDAALRAEIDRLRKIEEAARAFIDGEGEYAGSPAQNIETLFRKHGSELGQAVVEGFFDNLRRALYRETT